MSFPCKFFCATIVSQACTTPCFFTFC
uniref:Uncharacterized protein n=1 Tax=Arundo donax TaxID=35708 RepID=A0A0A9BUI1_ARUDO